MANSIKVLFNSWPSQVEKIAAIIGTPLTPQQVSLLRTYIELVIQWSPSHGLLATKEFPSLIDRHLIDCATLIPLLPLSGVGIDLGSGNGFPGIVISILAPHLSITLTESNHKKCLFLQYVIHHLSLPNISLHHGRIEDLPPHQSFNFATSRAFASLLDSVKLIAPLLPPSSQFFAMKGFHVEHDLDLLLRSPYSDLFMAPSIKNISTKSNIVMLTKR